MWGDWRQRASQAVRAPGQRRVLTHAELESRSSCSWHGQQPSGTIKRTIAREEWGSSLQRQIGEAKSAMGFASHTSDPPNAHSKGASELLAYYLAFPVIGGLRITPCGTRPSST